MAKVVGILNTRKEIQSVTTSLSQADIKDIRTITLSEDWEHELLREVPFIFRDFHYALKGILIGAITGLILAWLHWSNLIVPPMFTSFSAAGPWAVGLIWIGGGTAAGGLIGSMLSFSKPVSEPLEGKHLLVVHCRDGQKPEVERIITNSGGKLIK